MKWPTRLASGKVPDKAAYPDMKEGAVQR